MLAVAHPRSGVYHFLSLTSATSELVRQRVRTSFYFSAKLRWKEKMKHALTADRRRRGSEAPLGPTNKERNVPTASAQDVFPRLHPQQLHL